MAIQATNSSAKDILHTREYLNRGDIVELDCGTHCRFMLTDDSNFSMFKRGEGGFTCYGGRFKKFPARITPPSSGYWNITIELGPGSAQIHYTLLIVKAG